MNNPMAYVFKVVTGVGKNINCVKTIGCCPLAEELRQAEICRTKSAIPIVARVVSLQVTLTLTLTLHIFETNIPTLRLRYDYTNSRQE